MAGEPRPRATDLATDFLDGRRVDAALALGVRGREVGVRLPEDVEVRLEGPVAARMFLVEELCPVHPVSEELFVVQLLLQDDVRHREQDGRLAPWLGREPEVGHGGSVRQPRIQHGELSPLHDSLDDALGVRIEVVPRLQMRRQQEDELRIGEVGTGAIVLVPEGVSGAGARRADVGVGVVSVESPGVDHAIHIPLVPGSTDVVGDLVLPVVLDGLTHLACDVVECVAPGDARPLAAPARSVALERIQDALGIVHLVDRCRPLRAVPTAAPRMFGVALDLPDLAALFVDVGEQATAGFTVETGRRNGGVLGWGTSRLVLDPVVPPIGIGIGPQFTLGGDAVDAVNAAALPLFFRLFGAVRDEAESFGQFLDAARIEFVSHGLGE